MSINRLYYDSTQQSQFEQQEASQISILRNESYFSAELNIGNTLKPGPNQCIRMYFLHWTIYNFNIILYIFLRLLCALSVLGPKDLSTRDMSEGIHPPCNSTSFRILPSNIQYYYCDSNN